MGEQEEKYKKYLGGHLGQRMIYRTGIDERIQEVKDNQNKIFWQVQLKGWEGKRWKKVVNCNCNVGGENVPGNKGHVALLGQQGQVVGLGSMAKWGGGSGSDQIR